MNLGVLTSLYPSPVRPREGLFAERRWVGMQARGHHVRVVQPLPRAPWPLSLRRAWGEIAASPELEVRTGIQVRRPRYLHWPGRARGNARRFAEVGVAHLLESGPPDVVIADYAWPASQAAPLFARRGVPFVVHGRGSDILQVSQEAGLGAELALALRTAGTWCAVSSDLVRRMDELAGLGPRGVLVPNGVDLELFRPRERSAARDLLGLPADLPIVLVVGHLIPRKDPELALEVFARWLEQSDGRGLLVFIGAGERRAALESRARERKLTGRVRFEGEHAPEQLAQWYAACDVLLLTSSREGRPNVVLEALASGRAVLATRAGGTEELLVDLPECLADSRDPERLASQLALLLSQPPATARLCRAVAGLSWQAGLDLLEQVLESARARSSRRP